MLDRNKVQEILKLAMTKGDFAELFFEETTKFSLKVLDGKLEDVNSTTDFGVGVRILNGNDSVYGCTNDTSYDSIVEVTKKLLAAVGTKGGDVCPFEDSRIENKHNIKIMPNTVEPKEKVDMLKRACTVAKEYSHLVSSVTASYFDTIQNIEIFNSEGLNKKDTRVHTRMAINVVAKDGVKMESATSSPGGHKGFEFYTEDVNVDEAATKAAKLAVTLLEAEYAPSGEFPVIMENGFGGVIFHEACGHGLEATSVSKGLSVFCNKVGEKVAHESVTAVDDGTIENGWGSANIDDEGNDTKRNVLIENGILKGYMVDKLGGRRMNAEVTGNSRRQSYKFAPTSRMTNTFIDQGTSSLEEMLKDIKFGLYAAQMGGGSVNTTTGDFNFSVLEGYLIEEGKITKPVKGATLIGNGPKVLHLIDMVGDNLSRGQGMCGSVSGSIPADVGQPRIRISNITVGGRRG